MGIGCQAMLTGDNARAAESAAGAAGLTEFRAGLLPDDKLDIVRQYQVKYGVVAMVGTPGDHFLAVTEAFWVQMKVALFLGLFIAAPGILWQVWRFVEPGLHGHDKSEIAPYLK